MFSFRMFHKMVFSRKPHFTLVTIMSHTFVVGFFVKVKSTVTAVYFETLSARMRLFNFVMHFSDMLYHVATASEYLSTNYAH